MGILAASTNPLDHVVDKPLFDGFVHGGSFQYLFEEWGIGKHILMFYLAGALTVLLFWSRARQAETERVPGRFGNLIEVIMLFLRDQVSRPFLGKEGDKYLPFVWTFFFFILITNFLGLIPLFDFLGHGGNTATANIAITGALALCSFVLYHGFGLLEQGNPWTYFRNLFPHVPLLLLPLIFVIEIMAHIIRPCALAIRLCANMVAGHTLIAAILMLGGLAMNMGFLGGTGVSAVGCLAVVALTFLELIVATIQAFVFAFLSTVFLSIAVHPEH